MYRCFGSKIISFLKIKTGTLNIDDHPRILTEQHLENALQTQIKLEKKERAPQLSVAPFFESELDKKSVGIGLSVELPIFYSRQAPDGSV